ncbi:MAG: MBG domain-containing protein, partial [Akkermansiaceae bacterium]|nr:MBG domain-containing protein [Akkermansiaceae bacterium]
MNLGLRIPVPALFALLPMLVSSLRGATVSKANNGDSLNLTTSWTGSVVPCTTDIAQWDSTVTSANTTLLGGNLSISGLKVTSPGGAVTFSAGDTLTVGTSGIDLSSASQDLTIGSGLTLKGKQTWKSFTGRTLSVSGTVSQGTGSVDLSNFKGTLSSLSNHSSGILGAWATTGGALATAVATIDSGTVTALNLVGDNTGYTSAPTVTIQAPASGTTATATATFDAASGSVTGFTITNAGSGYTSIPRVNISATANRINYATNTSGVVSAYTAATAATTADLSNVTSATTNYSFGAAAALTANITANTLRFQGATCILANTNNKNITLNGLMSAGNTGSGSGGVLTVGSAGAATSTTNQIKIGASGVLNITTAVDNTFSSGSAPSSSMIINMPITGIGSSVVVNAGAKDLILLGSGTTKTTNPRSTFSRMFINSGYVRLPAKGDGALGGYSTPNSNTVTADGAQLTIEKGGELRMDNNTIAGNLTLNGGTLSWINAYGDIWNSAINQSYITINADSTFYSGATGKLSVNLPITGTGGLTKTGAGTASLVLTANNTFTGRTVINGGVITYSKSYALYGGDTSKWTASNITVKPIQSPLTATAPTPTLRLAAGGTDEFTGEHLSTLLTNLTASVNNNGLQDGSFVGIDTTNAPSAVVISGNIYDSVGAGGGSVSLKSFGNGTLTLAGNNTYSGKTAVDVSQTNAEAILSVSSLNSVTTNATLGTVHSTSSNLGSPTTVANGTIDLGSTGIQGSTGVLKYTGTGETTDRVVNLNAQALSTGVIEQAGTGLLKFTSPIALYAGADYYKTLKLRGDTAGTGEMAGTIANNSGTGNTATSVNKSGTGTWTLSGNNTYTGTTVVEGGRLVLKGTNVAPSLTVNKDAYLAIEGSGSIGTKVDNTSTYSGNIDASGELYFNSSVDHVLTGLVYCNGTVGTVGNVRKGGTGRLTITDVTSTQATGTASLSGDTVASIALATAGTGFTDGSTAVVRITGGGGSGATATADVDYYTGKVTKINLVTPGSGYTSAPTVTVTAQDAKWPMAWTKSTIVEGGTIVVNGYSLFDTSSLTLDGGKVEISNGATEVVNTLLFGSIPQPIGTYGSMASNATFKDDVHFDGTGMVSVTAYASTFGTWLTTNALTGANADATADSDGDGLNNALEFVLGGIADPYSAEDTNSIGLLPVRSKNANGDIVFTFHRKDVSEGESALIFQWATDKTFSVTYDVTIGATDSVTDDVVVDVTEDDPDAATDTIVVTVPASKALAGKAYGRLVAMGTTYSEDGRDFDRDGLTNFEEIVIHGTNFSVADSDGDGLSDGFETKTYGSNPMLADTDADGVNDGQEIALGRNPLKSEIELILGSLSQQYDGTAKSASAMTTPSGFSVSLTYNGSATAPTAAGSYAVVGTIDDVNYTASANGTLVISKAVATVTLGSLSATYDGTVKLASATTTPSGLGVSFTYDGSPTAPTAAGSYAVVGTIDDANYIGVASGTLVIAKGEATVTLCNLSTTYDGTAKSASATTTPSGLSVNFTYNGSSTAPSAVGSYAVVGTINDANYTGSASGTLVISKGAGTVTLGSLTTTYDGTPKAASAITTPSGLGVNLTYNGSSTAPTAAGSYAVGGTINDVNYTGSANATLVISKGAATVTLGSLVQIDDGTAKSATAITSPAGLKVDFSYNGTSTAPTATGNYTVTGTIRDLNYQGSASGTLALVSSPTISVQPTSVTANQGETVTFNVVAAGNNLSYQWQKNGADIPEAVMASLTIAQVQLADEGSYTVKISNLAGNITSQPANLAALFGPGDLDGDGLTNNEESMIYHTNPNLADTDHDGLTDGYEVGIGRFSVVLGS